MVAARVRVVLATFWVGSLWTIGYIVAPTLFAALQDRALAGTLAGRMFQIEAWITIVCALLLTVLVIRAAEVYDARQRKHILIVIALMLVCTLISHFGIQPIMAELRASVPSGSVMGSEAAARFGKLHGVSSGIYLLQSVLGLVLVLKLFQVK